jgi:hypothetical protein
LENIAAASSEAKQLIATTEALGYIVCAINHASQYQYCIRNHFTISLSTHSNKLKCGTRDKDRLQTAKKVVSSLDAAHPP